MSRLSEIMVLELIGLQTPTKASVPEALFAELRELRPDDDGFCSRKAHCNTRQHTSTHVATPQRTIAHHSAACIAAARQKARCSRAKPQMKTPLEDHALKSNPGILNAAQPLWNSPMCVDPPKESTAKKCLRTMWYNNRGSQSSH